MNITLGSEFERRIAEKLESGLYTSSSEVIREGLRLLFERDLLREKQMEVLQREVANGFLQLDSGQYREQSVKEIFQQAMDAHDEGKEK